MASAACWHALAAVVLLATTACAQRAAAVCVPIALSETAAEKLSALAPRVDFQP